MTTIVYNILTSALKKNSESFALRTAYLISDETIIAGSTGANLFFDKIFNGLPVRKKLQAFEKYFREEYGDMFDALNANFKAAEKIKHKNTQQIVAYKKLEQKINEICAEMVNGFMDMQYKAGFDVIKELMEDDVFGVYDTDLEVKKDARLFQRILPDEYEKNAMFFLQPEFLHKSTFLTEEEANNETEQDDNDKSVSLCLLFTLPNINILSATELRAVKKSLEPATDILTQQADAWAALLYNNAGESARATYMDKKLLPAAAAVQKLIDDDKILQHCNRLHNDKVKMEVYAAEVPVYKLWHFFKSFKAIENETAEILDQLKEQEVFKDVQWPVFALNLVENKGETNETAKTEESVSLKKSISVD